MGESSWRIRDGGLDTPEVQRLLAHHMALSAAESEGSDHALSAQELSRPDIFFWTAWQARLLLGCIALKRLSPQAGEIKSMHVAVEARGRGVGQALLDHLIDEARTRGFTRLCLETGHRPHFASAVRLYRRSGFVVCSPFPPYVNDPRSLFLTLSLDSGVARQEGAGTPWLPDGSTPP